MTTEQAEREKYEKIWAFPSYRMHSPGEQMVEKFLEKCAWQPTDYIIDFGCGTGRAGLKLKAAGLNPILVDITETCLDDEAKGLAFLTANLWDLPPLRNDWIFSCDTLEHLPTEHIDAALQGMADATAKGGLLQIAMFKDNCGDMIGETLHLTVKPVAWWMEKIEKLWDVREWSVDRYDRLVVILGKGKDVAR